MMGLLTEAGMTSRTLDRFIASAPRLAAGLAIAIGFLVLAGWTFEIAFLRSVIPGWDAMKANTAIGLVLAGVSLWLPRGKRSWTAAGIVVVLGAISFAETAFGWNAGIDELLFTDVQLGPGSAGPGRMAPNTALSFMALGTALILAREPNRWLRRSAEILCSAVVLIAILALIGHVLEVDVMAGGIANYATISVPTLGALLLLAIGVLTIIPNGWFIARATSAGPDGTVIRRLTPIVIAVPIVLGWLRLLGQEQGWYGTRFGISLVAGSAVTLLGAAVFSSVAVLQRESQKRQAVEAALRDSEERQRLAVDGAHVGMWFWHVPTDDLDFTPECKKHFGLDLDQKMSYAVFEAALHPEDRERTRQVVQRSWDEHTSYQIDYRSLWRDGSIHWLAARGWTYYDADGNVERMSGVVLDIDERKRAEEALARSNSDLERFAYVASHDLQEPLRMVGSYVQLLANRYRGRLDSDADEFIAFAVEGAQRMQRMIEDLLAYSRVNTRGSNLAHVSVQDALDGALASLKLAIEDAGVVITSDPLPVVHADLGQLEHVFTNLVGNAIKFRNTESPHVHIHADRGQAEWVFSVKDNGIGIDPQYSDRIFILFQRLHGRAEYPGTGMGLAIAKRIVERHGGRMWVKSEPGLGATFTFTLPATPEAIA